MTRRIVPSTPPVPPKKARRRLVEPGIPSAWSNKLLLHIESPDPRLLDKEAGKIYYRIRESGARVWGPIPLPVDRRSGSSEGEDGQRIHRRLIQILFPREETITLLEKLSLSRTVQSSILVEEADLGDPSAAAKRGES